MYKSNFRESLLFWGLELIISFIIYIDILYTNVKGLLLLHSILVMMGIMTVCVGFYVFPIISRFYFKFKDVLRISFNYSIIGIKTTILIILAFISSKVVILWMFFPTIFSYMIMYFEKNIIEKIEKQLAERQTFYEKIN